MVLAVTSIAISSCFIVCCGTIIGTGNGVDRVGDAVPRINHERRGEDRHYVPLGQPNIKRVAANPLEGAASCAYCPWNSCTGKLKDRAVDDSRETLRFLQIEPTTRCNFTCSFCCGRQLPQRDLCEDTFFAALLLSRDLAHLEMQGEGETLLHPHFASLLAQARRRELSVSLVTNGSLLSDQMVSCILDLGVEKIWVSLESVDPVRFERIRGGRLEIVEEGLTRLLSAKQRRGLNRPAVGLSITILQRTRDELPAILSFYQRLGLDGGILAQPLQQMEAYVGTYTSEMTAEILAVRDKNDLWIRLVFDPRFRRFRTDSARRPGFYDVLMRGWYPGSRRCPWLDQGAFVTVSGDVTPCCRIKDTKKYGLGCVGINPPENILASRKPLRTALFQGFIPSACRGCELARYAVASKAEVLRLGRRGLWLRYKRLWRRESTRTSANPS